MVYGYEELLCFIDDLEVAVLWFIENNGQLMLSVKGYALDNDG